MASDGQDAEQIPILLSVYWAGRMDELNDPTTRINFYQTKKRESDSFYETMRDRNKGVPGIVEDLNIIERL